MTPGRDLALALCRAAGVDPDAVTGLTLTLDVDDVPRLDVRCVVLPEPDGAGWSEVTERIERYRLVPIGEPEP